MYQKNLKSLEEDISKADTDISYMMSVMEETQNASKMSQERMTELKVEN